MLVGVAANLLSLADVLQNTYCWIMWELDALIPSSQISAYPLLGIQLFVDAAEQLTTPTSARALEKVDSDASTLSSGNNCKHQSFSGATVERLNSLVGRSLTNLREVRYFKSFIYLFIYLINECSAYYLSSGSSIKFF